MCVCVREREREGGEREGRERGETDRRNRGSSKNQPSLNKQDKFLVCEGVRKEGVKERERERERMRERKKERE